jgi:glycosyltransferase involved in cell wall biosynthesis
LKILFLSFYYSPDLCAGSFRATRLISALLEQLPDGAHIEVITTQPNRYSSYHNDAPEFEELPKLTIRRIKVPAHKSGMIDQMWAFAAYARQVLKLVRNSDYQLVFGTSSRLMTAALSAYVARKKNAPLYLDIRDNFVYIIKDLLPKQAAPVTISFFSLVERWTIKRANRINLISRGFKGYFQARFPGQKYSYFSNCIDPEFIESDKDDDDNTAARQAFPLTALYAGNIGEGQGLHKIVPELAKHLEGRIVFRLIGDGGRKAQLEQRLAELDCKNVELLAPVKRSKLVAEYQKADILFVHLNDYDALSKVLPSKLFEYAATGKPVWVGVSGYPATFIEKEISNAAVFQPCNVDEAIDALAKLKVSRVKRTGFIEKFSCKSIMKRMAADIIAVGSKDD